NPFACECRLFSETNLGADPNASELIIGFKIPEKTSQKSLNLIALWIIHYHYQIADKKQSLGELVKLKLRQK
ncbi:hypothetical protein AB6C94_25115, partial [Vibrio splendidus]